MKVSIICFTKKGSEICHRLHRWAEEKGWDVKACVPPEFYRREHEEAGIEQSEKGELTQWAQECFRQERAMIFIGATGIAVRAIAPWVKDKFQDPPVVVVDEQGRYAIPILSGHIGGANELADQIGCELGATPIITTATDLNSAFAVDLFARINELKIMDRELAKEVSATILKKEPVGFFCDFPIDAIPNGCVEEVCGINIWITMHSFANERRVPEWVKEAREKGCKILRLVPVCMTLGVGCKKNQDLETVRGQILSAFDRAGMEIQAVRWMASIDIKREEEALLKLAEQYGWELRFYSASRLLQVPGEFSESEFVRSIMGIGNVCERAACAEGGRLILHKNAGAGVTVAAAMRPYTVTLS